MSAKGPSDPAITRARLMSLYYDKEDTSLDEVAAALGYSREAVRRWCQHFGIPVKPKSREGGKRVKHSQLMDREWLAEQLKTKMQIEIAAELGAKVPAVNYWVKKHGLADLDKGKSIADALQKRYPQGRSGGQAANWRGGRRIQDGYVMAYAPDHPAAHNGVVFEHRLVAEQQIGRYLEPDEVVHHIDGNRQNNRPENLIVKQRGQHVSEHFQASHEVKGSREKMQTMEQRIQELEDKVQELEQQTLGGRLATHEDDRRNS